MSKILKIFHLMSVFFIISQYRIANTVFRNCLREEGGGMSEWITHFILTNILKQCLPSRYIYLNTFTTARTKKWALKRGIYPPNSSRKYPTGWIYVLRIYSRCWWTTTKARLVPFGSNRSSHGPYAHCNCSVRRYHVTTYMSSSFYYDAVKLFDFAYSYQRISYIIVNVISRVYSYTKYERVTPNLRQVHVYNSLSFEMNGTIIMYFLLVSSFCTTNGNRLKFINFILYTVLELHKNWKKYAKT